MSASCSVEGILKTQNTSTSSANYVGDVEMFLLENPLFQFKNYKELVKGNIPLHVFLTKKIREYVAQCAFGNRKAGFNNITVDLETFRKNIATLKLELLKIIFKPSLRKLILTDGSIFNINTPAVNGLLFDPSGANQEAYTVAAYLMNKWMSENFDSVEQINALNPYNENSKDVANKFLAIYMLQNFDEILQDVLGEEVSIVDPNLATTSEYTLNKFEANQNQYDEAAYNISSHVSRRLKLLFSTIPMTLLYKDADGNVRWKAIENKYLSELSIYLLGMILRQIETLFLAMNPHIQFNLDANPERNIRILLEWGINGIDSVRKYFKLNLNDIPYFSQGKNKLLLGSIYAYLYGTTLIDGSWYNGLFNINLKLQYDFETQTAGIRHKIEDLDKLVLRELLKVGHLAYVSLKSDFTYFGDKSDQIKTNYVQSMWLNGRDAIPLHSGLKEFAFWLYNNRHLLSEQKLNSYTTASIAKTDPVIQEFCEMVLKLENIDSGYFDLSLDVILPNIVFLVNKLSNIYKLMDEKSFPNLTERFLFIQNKIKNLTSDNNFEDNLVDIAPFFDAYKITTYINPSTNANNPAFGLQTLIMKDALMIDEYINERGFEKSDNFFTDGTGNFAHSALFSNINNVNYPGSTVIMDQVIDDSGMSTKFLQLNENDSFLSHMIGGFFTGLQLTEHKRKNRIVMTKITTYSDKARAFMKCFNGEAQVNVIQASGNGTLMMKPMDFADFVQKPALVKRMDYYYRKNQLISELVQIIDTYRKYGETVGFKIDNAQKAYEQAMVEATGQNTIEKLLNLNSDFLLPLLAQCEQLLLNSKIDDINKWCSDTGNVIINYLSYLKYKDPLDIENDPDIQEYVHKKKQTIPDYQFPLTFGAGVGLNRVLVGDLLKLNSFQSFNNWVDLDVKNNIAKFRDVVYKWADNNTKVAKKVFPEIIQDGNIDMKVIDSAIEQYTLASNFLARQYLDLTIGLYYKDKPNQSFQTIEQERSARLAASTKRTIGYTSTKEEAQQNLLKGVNKEIKVAVIGTYELPTFGSNGKMSNLSVYNGAGFICPYQSLMENVSYGWGNYGTKKTIGQGFFNKIPSSIIFKWAEFPISNEYMRNQDSDIPPERLFKKMTSIPFASCGFNGNLLQSFAGSNYFNAILQEEPYYYYDSNSASYKRVVSVEYVEGRKYKINTIECNNKGELLSENMSSKIVNWTCLYDVFDSLHGIDCCSLVNGKLEFSELIHSLICNMIINVGEVTGSKELLEIEGYNQNTVKLPLRQAFIAILATDDAVKNGMTNLNDARRYEDSNGLNIFVVKTNQFGKSLEAGHVIDGETEIKELTLAFNAMGLMGYFLDDVHMMYSNIATLVQRAMTESEKGNILDDIIIDLLNSNNIEEPAVLWLLTLRDSNYDINSLPSDPILGNEIIRSIISKFNKEFVRRTYPGGALVLNPTSHFWQLFRIGNGQGITASELLLTGINFIQDGTINRKAFLLITSKNLTELFLQRLPSGLKSHNRSKDYALKLLTLLHINNPNILKDLSFVRPELQDIKEQYLFLLDHYDDPILTMEVEELKNTNPSLKSITLLEPYSKEHTPEVMDKAIIVNKHSGNVEDVLLENSSSTRNVDNRLVEADRLRILRITEKINDPDYVVMQKLWKPTELLGTRQVYTVKSNNGDILEINDMADLIGGARAVNNAYKDKNALREMSDTEYVKYC